MTQKLLARCCKEPGWGQGVAFYKKAEYRKKTEWETKIVGHQSKRRIQQLKEQKEMERQPEGTTNLKNWQIEKKYNYNKSIMLYHSIGGKKDGNHNRRPK